MLRKIFGFVAAAVVLGVLAGAVPGLLDRYASQPDDFVQYWDTAKVVLSGRNAYLPAELANLPKPSGWVNSADFHTWIPPWSIAFILPFGLVDYPVARLLWLALCFALVFVAGHFWLRVYLGPQRCAHLSWLVPVVVFSCYPAIVVLSIGQIGPLVLAGLTGWYYFTERGRNVAAGSCLVLAAVKPHLLLVFWAALLIWVLRDRKWGQLLGGAVALLIAMSVPLLWNQQVVRQYFVTIANQPPVFWATSTVGAFLMFGLGSAKSWILFVPAVLGTAWVSFSMLGTRFQRQRPGRSAEDAALQALTGEQWEWRDELPLILLVSVLTSPFGWYWDLVILIPAFMQMAAWLVTRRSLALAVLPVYLGINAGAYVMNLFAADALFYFWIAPALLLLFLVARAAHFRQAIVARSSVAAP